MLNRFKENIKASRYWLLCGESTSDRRIPLTKGELCTKCFHRWNSLIPGACERSGTTEMTWCQSLKGSCMSRVKSVAGLANNITDSYIVWLHVIWVQMDPRMATSDPSKKRDYVAKLRRTLEMQDETEDVVVLVGWGIATYHIDGSMQKRHNSIANALELRLSRINQSTCSRNWSVFIEKIICKCLVGCHHLGLSRVKLKSIFIRLRHQMETFS